jgi:antitoxin MazE
MTSRVQRWGNSLAVRIPAPFARELGLSTGSAVKLRLVDGALRIEPVPDAPTIAALLTGVTAENVHGEAGWKPARAPEDC